MMKLLHVLTDDTKVSIKGNDWNKSNNTLEADIPYDRLLFGIWKQLHFMIIHRESN